MDLFVVHILLSSSYFPLEAPLPNWLGPAVIPPPIENSLPAVFEDLYYSFGWVLGEPAVAVFDYGVGHSSFQQTHPVSLLPQWTQ